MFVFCSSVKCNVEQISLLLTHGADATIGIENTGRNEISYPV